MRDISNNAVPYGEELKGLGTQTKTIFPAIHLSMRKLLLLLLAVFLIFMFLPWTQNVQGDGFLTTQRPEQRPQTIHATIAGRIEQWYITEGQAVQRGDTIVYLSEVKPDYLDPQLVARTGGQVTAKEGAITYYGSKVRAVEAQILAMERERENKLQQVQNKIRQAELKIESEKAALEQARADIQIARRQVEGVRNLYEKGLKSLTEWEDKKAKMQESEAKLVGAENKLASARNDLDIYQSELSLTRNEYANKIAKAQSEKFSTLSEKYDAEASVNKLRIEQENYSRRSSFYYILAPQDGYIVKSIMPGVGEIIKEGDPIVSILPANYALAVEMYIRPMDLPLITVGRGVRFAFDGWPSFFFSGWPGVSTGMFSGRVFAIDRNISPNGKFRVLVAPDPAAEPWPSALQVGGGAKGIAMLDNVPLWYELWRMLNGFPPNLYQPQTGEKATGNKNPKAKPGQ